MKRIVFLTGTRADFGKLKSLIEITSADESFEVHLFVTGMHLSKKYGSTVDEIIKCGYRNIYQYINQTTEETMDHTLARTVVAFSDYVKHINPDLIVVHGDRLEALAGAIVGAFNNILVAHIEGGEVSGTVDELTRHAISKLSHAHFVSNETARRRLIQMGERSESVHVIGSPDVDVMMSDSLPDLADVKRHYEIGFDDYAVLLFHPVTTEVELLDAQAKDLVNAVLESNLNYVVIYPNNDMGSSLIIHHYQRLLGNPRFRIFPSIRFEKFLVLLKNASFIVGNSSAGIREAPYYGLPTVNIGSRQSNRAGDNSNIIHCGCGRAEILEAIRMALALPHLPTLNPFGTGNSAELFFRAVTDDVFAKINRQKQFVDTAHTV
ncbi:MAG: UDP-N-acetylglucosamine 2-epimerase [Luteolibacter sp.]|uniref:UDP-N-acetylglucosamine 2-epimerase n=1 Tax=Luteolibacter sp. TaxID=1962973 RepID=UPI0032673570